MRQITNTLFFLLGITIGAIFALNNAHAETMPATATQSLMYGGYSDPQQFCSSLTSQYTCSGNAVTATAVTFGTNGVQCNFKNISNNANCRVEVFYGTTGTTYSCPTTGGWTLSGSSCTRPDCVSPQVRQSNGTCAAPACPDGQTRGTTGIGECKTQCAESGSIGKQTGDFVSSGSMSPTSVCAEDGCNYKPTDCLGINGYIACKLGKSTGTTCKSSAYDANGNSHQTAEQQAAAKLSAAQQACTDNGKCPITINGAVTCGSCAQAYTETVKTVTNPDGSQTVTNTATTANINGSSVNYSTGTTTTNTSSGGGQGTTSQSAETGTTNTNGFCQQNPSATICTGNSDQKTDCDKYPSSAGCSQLGEAEQVGNIQTVERGIESLTPVSLPGSATCPADVPLPHGMSFSWAPICTYATALKPVILAMAWLAAGLIILGVKTDG